MSVRILTGDCRDVMRTLPDASVQCCVTSPPYYGLRDYGVAGQIGLEQSPEEYVAQMVAVFREVRRVLRDDGTCWVNLGDSYAGGGGGNYTKGTRNNSGENVTNVRNRPEWLENAGTKPKDLLMMPVRVALALQADGWYLRSDIIWHKPNPMPESVTDRPTSAYEHVFLLTKSPRYFYDADAVREPQDTANPNHPGYRAIVMPGRGVTNGAARNAVEREQFGVNAGMDRKVLNPSGRNMRNVWTIATAPYPAAHFATFPPELAERCIRAGTRPGDTVLDPFGGAGTTGLVASRLRRDAILIELNADYVAMARSRIDSDLLVRQGDMLMDAAQ